MGARYYDGTRGRFISQDPVFLAVGDLKLMQEKTHDQLDFYFQNPQTHNSYSYTANNPLKYVDKNGEYLELTFSTPAIYPIIGVSGSLQFDSGGINAAFSWNSGVDIGFPIDDNGVSHYYVIIHDNGVSHYYVIIHICQGSAGSMLVVRCIMSSIVPMHACKFLIPTQTIGNMRTFSKRRLRSSICASWHTASCQTTGI
jgi:RHS repeat-associated protein